MTSSKILISLIPWILFSLITSHAGADYVGWAALAAGVTAVAIAVRGVTERTANGTRSRLKTIDAAGVVTFGVMTALAFAGSGSVREHIADYGRGCCALILALVMLGSVLVLPFTEQYARESVDPRYWHSPVFRAVNRRISAAFGFALLVMSAGHFYSGYLSSLGDLTRRTNFILNWAIPVLVIVAAIKYGKQVRDTAMKTSTAMYNHLTPTNPLQPMGRR